MSTPVIQHEQGWLKVLGKGMVTLPKKWREMLGVAAGDIVRARREGRRIIIEPYQTSEAPYRVYSDEEINEFLIEDVLPEVLSKKVKRHQRPLR